MKIARNRTKTSYISAEIFDSKNFDIFATLQSLKIFEKFLDFVNSEVTIFDRFSGSGRICKTSVNKSKVDSMD